MQNSGCGTTILATAMMVIVVACGISEIGTVDIPEDKEQDGIGSPVRSVCCVSGFEYPSGYEWNKGVADGYVRCSLVVCADGVPKMKVPVGDGYEVDSDPDMNRVIGGDLYTFYSKDGRTVVRRNGAPLFRYDADEVLVDMSVKGEDVFTLAHKRSGEGFSFRKNGEVMLERFSGETFGKLWEDGDSLCFAFVQPVALNDGLEYRHYIACDATTSLVKDIKGFERVWDIISDGGIPCILVSYYGTGDTYMIRGRAQKWMEIPYDTEMLSCSFFQADDMIGVECVYSYRDGTYGSGIWVEGSEYMQFETGSSIQALKYTEGKAYCILHPDDEEGIIFDAGEIVHMPDGYFCLDERAMAVREGVLYVGLSSRTGGHPLVWHDGKTDTLRFNGCVTSVTFVDAKDIYASQKRVRD